MHDAPQRRMVVICDMVTIGQGEGPLLPEPGKWHMLVFCDEPVAHDIAMARLMGTDESVIATVREARAYDGRYAWCDADEPLPICASNDPAFNGIRIDELDDDMRFVAKSTSGWAACFRRRE